MSDPTREQTVVANNQAVENKYGPENFWWVIINLLKDINISLAKLIDAGNSNQS